MKLIFFRHGIAEEKEPDQTEMDDFGRCLTKEGIIEAKEMIQAGHYLFKKLDGIFTSPLVRAVQTAQILYSQKPECFFEILPTLDSLSPYQDFQNDLKKLKDGTYCFVGHEPHLSTSINLLLNKKSESGILLAKGGVVVLEGPHLNELKISAVLSPKLLTKLEY